MAAASFQEDIVFSRGRRRFFSTSSLRDLAELTKLRLVSLSLFSAAAGFYLALPDKLVWGELFFAMIAIGLTAAGSQALNQWMEKEADAKMLRTRNRPIPAGRLSAVRALYTGLALLGSGLFLLGTGTNVTATALAAVTVVLYLGLYTPLKQLTPWCTLVGAVPGALPPLVGWAARTGTLSFQAWSIFLIIFLWQVPHFFAIAWSNRDDYERAGFVIRPVIQKDGRAVAQEALVYLYLLLPVSLLPWVTGLTGMVYAAAAALLSFLLIGAGRLARDDMDKHAKTLFWGTIIYLTLLLIFMIGDKI